jgi:hypothetical protein
MDRRRMLGVMGEVGLVAAVSVGRAARADSPGPRCRLTPKISEIHKFRGSARG